MNKALIDDARRQGCRSWHVAKNVDAVSRGLETEAHKLAYIAVAQVGVLDERLALLDLTAAGDVGVLQDRQRAGLGVEDVPPAVEAAAEVIDDDVGHQRSSRTKRPPMLRKVSPEPTPPPKMKRSPLLELPLSLL